MNILLTRAKKESEKMAQTFNRLGHTTIIDSMIETIPIPDWFDQYKLIKQNIELIVFTSKYAIQEFARKEVERTVEILVVGEKSLDEAKKNKFLNIEVADGNAKSVLKKILLTKKLNNILYLSGENITLDLDKILLSKGLDCKRIKIYKTNYANSLKDSTISLLLKQKIDIIIIYSELTAKTFKKNILKVKKNIDFSTTKLLVLSSKIAQVLNIFNFNEVLIYNNNEILTECGIIKVISGGL